MRTNDHAPNPPSTGAKIDSFLTGSVADELKESATDGSAVREAKTKEAMGLMISNSMLSGLWCIDMAVELNGDMADSSHDHKK